MAVVVVEPVGLRRVAGGRTVIRFARQAGAGDIVVHAIPKLVADVQIEPAATVEVEKRGGKAPTRGVGTRLLRDVGKRAIVIVPKQLVVAEPGDIDVDPSIVVDVAGRHAHAVVVRHDSARFSDVGQVYDARAVG